MLSNIFPTVISFFWWKSPLTLTPLTCGNSFCSALTVFSLLYNICIKEDAIRPTRSLSLPFPNSKREQTSQTAVTKFQAKWQKTRSFWICKTAVSKRLLTWYKWLFKWLFILVSTQVILYSILQQFQIPNSKRYHSRQDSWPMDSMDAL